MLRSWRLSPYCCQLVFPTPDDGNDNGQGVVVGCSVDERNMEACLVLRPLNDEKRDEMGER